MHVLEELSREQVEVSALAEKIRELCGDDDQAFCDTLAGASNVEEAASAVVRWITECETWAKANKDTAEIYTMRAKVLGDRKERGRTALLRFMDALGVRSLPLPEANLSIRQGTPSVAGEADVTKLPPRLVRITQAPDLAAIKAALQAGETVEGVTLSNGPPSLTIRRA